MHATLQPLTALKNPS